MSYYKKITSKALFEKHVQEQEGKSFSELYLLDNFQQAASRWSTDHLFASRVICWKPRNSLLILESFVSPLTPGVSPCIDGLVQGPDRGYEKKFEPEIIREYVTEGLGYTWAALARLVRAEKHQQTMTSERSTRTRQQAPMQPGFVSSRTMRAGSSSPEQSADETSSDSSAASLGWMTSPAWAPLEDLTVRFASCFIRCVINHGQPVGIQHPIYFRDEHRTYSFSYAGEKHINAADDGGIQFSDGKQLVQVAMLEAKRAFDKVKEGKPILSDRLLAQLVGEAIALRRTVNANTVQNSEIMTILAVSRYVKFFHFKITAEFISHYEGTSSHAPHLEASSTHWFDLQRRGHRKRAIQQILALLAWANNRQGEAAQASGDEDTDMMEGSEMFQDTGGMGSEG